MNRKTKFLTTCMFNHLRFVRNLWCIATEVWHVGISDIIAINKGKVSEYEVKVSQSDLQHEIKKRKHYLPKPQINYYSLVIPNNKRMFFSAKKFISTVNPKYGIITVNKNGVITIRKKASLLSSDNQATLQLEKNVFQRATSEVATLNMVLLLSLNWVKPENKNDKYYKQLLKRSTYLKKEFLRSIPAK